MFALVFTRRPSVLPCASMRELGMADMVAAVRVGQERLAAVAGPLHGPAADLLRGPGDDAFLVVDEDLRAEAAADVGRHHAQLVLGRHADEGRHDQAMHVRVLAGDVAGEGVRAGVVVADRRARLHRVRHQPVVDEIDPGDVRRLGERGVRRGLVAELPVEDQVVGDLVVDQRRRRRARRRRPRPDRARA